MADDRPDSPTLSDAQVQRLAAVGTERDVAAGDLLFREGDPAYDFFVVLDGAVDVYADPECQRPITKSPIRAGQMLGEMGLLLGESVYATARVEEDGRVLQVPADAFRDLIGRDTGLAETILEAFAERRGMVSAGASGLTLVGAQTDPDAVRLAEFARRNYLPVRWLTPDDADAAEVFERTGRTASDTPFVVWGTETVLDNPTPLELAEAVGIVGEMPEDETADVIVIGAGPAGLAAAVYGASEGLKTVVVDEVGPGGQAGASSRIENYLGFPAGVSGTDLATRATVQARKFGACLATPRRATGLGRDGDAYTVALGSGPTLRGRTVVVATGANYNRLPLDNLRHFEGAGVYYAATEMEARGCQERTVIVVGGGNSAGQAAMFLSERASRVLLLLRGDDLGKSMSRYLADRVEASDVVEVRTHMRRSARSTATGPSTRRWRRSPSRHGDRRDRARRGAGLVRVHRREPVHRLAQRRRRPPARRGAGLEGVHPGRRRRPVGVPARRVGRRAAGPVRDVPPRRVRRRRRPVGLDEAGRGRGRGGVGRGQGRPHSARPAAPGDGVSRRAVRRNSLSARRRPIRSARRALVPTRGSEVAVRHQRVLCRRPRHVAPEPSLRWQRRAFAKSGLRPPDVFPANAGIQNDDRHGVDDNERRGGHRADRPRPGRAPRALLWVPACAGTTGREGAIVNAYP